MHGQHAYSGTFTFTYSTTTKTLTYTLCKYTKHIDESCGGEDLLYIARPGTTWALCCCSCGTDLTTANTRPTQSLLQ